MLVTRVCTVSKMAHSDGQGQRRDVGEPGGAGDDFTDAPSNPDAHHHTQESTTSLAYALDIKGGKKLIHWCVGSGSAKGSVGW